MNIAKLLEQYRQPEQSPVASPEPARGRTAELKRKFASRLAELSEVRLRPPVSDLLIAKLRRAVFRSDLPQEVLELYSVADGETTSGFFVPELEFLRVDYVLKLLQANDEAHKMGLLPATLESCVPLFRDSVGNQIVVMLGPVELCGQIAFINMEQPKLQVISRSTGHLISRLAQMKRMNQEAGKATCPGDFRNLTSAELVVASSVEP